MPTIVRLLRSNALLGDAKAEGAKVDDGINQSGTWSATIPSNSLVSELIMDGDTVHIIYNGIVLMGGLVNKINRNYIGGKSISISGFSLLDNLYKQVDSYIWCNNESILFPLARILRPYGWTINDISTMDDPLKLTTLDTRGEDTSASQMTKLLESNRLTNFRRDGDVGLELGRFNEFKGYLFTDPSPTLKTPSPTTGIITGLSVTEDSQEIISAIYATGGTYKPVATNDVNLDMKPIIEDDVSYEWDADFPIEIPIPEYTYRVRNVNVPAPGGKKIVDRKSYGSAGTYNEISIAVGDTNATAVIANRSAGFLIKPLHGYLKSLRFFVSLASGGFTGLRMFLVRLDMAVDTYPLVDMGNVWLNRDTDPRFVWGKEIPDPTSLLGAQILEWDDKEIPVEVGEAFALCFTYDSVLDQNQIRFLFHLQGNQIVNTDDGDWSISATADGSSGFVFNNDYTLVHEVESYPEDGTPRIVSENYSDYTPRDDSLAPSSAEILMAAQALYGRTIARLSDTGQVKKSYTMKSIVDIDFPSIGEMVRVKAQARTARRNSVSHILTPVVSSIDAEFMVQSYSLSLKASKIDANFTIVEGDGLTNLEKFKFTSIYDQTKPDENIAKEKHVASFLGSNTYEVVGVAVSGSSDTTLIDGTSAITVSLDSSILVVPSITPITDTYESSILYQASYPYPDPTTFLNLPDSDILIEEVSRIEAIGDIAEYKISTRRGWDSSYSMTVYFFMQWEF